MAASNNNKKLIAKKPNQDGTGWLTIAEHAFVTFSALYFGKKLYDQGIRASIEKATVGLVKALPGGSELIKQQQQKVVEKIESFVLNHKDKDKNYSLPKQGINKEELLGTLKEWRSKEKDYQHGKAFGGIYIDNEKLHHFQNEIYSLYSDSNALYPGVFPGLRKFEAEVAQIAVNLMNGNDQCCGTMTSGGTESIFLAIKGYRTHARKHKSFTGRPNIVVPQSAHAAFAKAAYYLDVEFRMVPIKGGDYRVKVNDVRSLMDQNTIAIVGSAPAFPQGVIDPIEQLSDLAQEFGCGLHVDACLGGFVLPFLEKLGHIKSIWDFRNKGVTSISADIHKYGFGPKGCSVILWNSPELRKNQFYKYTEWSGGIYCTSSFAGSRPGGIIAGAWATLMCLGESGYLKSAKVIHETLFKIVKQAPKIPGIQILGPPDACTVAIVSDDRKVDIFKVADALMQKNWQVNRLQKPICIQLQIGDRSNFDVDQFLKDLQTSVEAVRNNPDKFNDGLCAVYSDAANLGDRKLVADLMEEYLSALLKV